jgi:hypothetical protein
VETEESREASLPWVGQISNLRKQNLIIRDLQGGNEVRRRGNELRRRGKEVRGRGKEVRSCGQDALIHCFQFVCSWSASLVMPFVVDQVDQNWAQILFATLGGFLAILFAVLLTEVGFWQTLLFDSKNPPEKFSLLFVITGGVYTIYIYSLKSYFISPP